MVRAKAKRPRGRAAREARGGDANYTGGLDLAHGRGGHAVRRVVAVDAVVAEGNDGAAGDRRQPDRVASGRRVGDAHRTARALRRRRDHEVGVPVPSAAAVHLAGPLLNEAHDRVVSLERVEHAVRRERGGVGLPVAAVDGVVVPGVIVFRAGSTALTA